MLDLLIEHEPVIRLASFIAVLAAMALWETLAPRRVPHERRGRHLARNLAVTVIDALVVRLLVPLLPVGVAAIAQDRSWGLLNLTAWPLSIEITFAVLVFDLTIYGQHRLFHQMPWLWQLHKVHHSDLDYDTSTGVRFHPVEILLSLAIKSALVVALGPAPVAVLLFEVILNATALFNHGNVSIPGPVDRWLRLVFVTPDMHRVHHSVHGTELNSNYGFNVPWWDRLLGTYRDQPADGHIGMQIGIDEYPGHSDTTLGKLLLMPFRKAGRQWATSATSRP